MSRGASPRVSPKTGVSEGVSHEALRGPGSRVSKMCPESVPGVSGTPFDTRTLFGHSEAQSPKGPGPGDTQWDNPVFGDTLGDTTSGPSGPRERSVAGPGVRKARRPCHVSTPSSSSFSARPVLLLRPFDLA